MCFKLSIIIIIIIIRSKLCYIICIVEFSLCFISSKTSVFLLSLNDVFVTKAKSFRQVTHDSSRSLDEGGHASIVPKEGSGKATSSAVAAGIMGGREETAHTIEKELGGGREREGGCQRLGH